MFFYQRGSPSPPKKQEILFRSGFKRNEKSCPGNKNLMIMHYALHVMHKTIQLNIISLNIMHYASQNIHKRHYAFCIMYYTLHISNDALLISRTQPSQTRRWSWRKSNCYGWRQNKQLVKNRGILKHSWALVETNIHYTLCITYYAKH